MPRLQRLTTLLSNLSLSSSSTSSPLLPRVLRSTPNTTRTIFTTSSTRPTLLLLSRDFTPTTLTSRLPSSPLPTTPSPLNSPINQIRWVTYGMEYQPSQRKRKRKHGFLVRSKGGKAGRKILAGRRMKGRRFLSH